MVVEAEVGGGDKHGAVEFQNLPEDCIANVISFTTPRDASAFSLVSSTFRSASQSDVVWEKFLPSDYRTIIAQAHHSSDSLLCYDSKKDLFLHLCHKPLLIDRGTKSFALDKEYGKKCYMLSARALSIVWGDTPRYWRWISVPEARFSEVAELVGVCWLEIKGCIKTSMLSPETKYGAYIVYKLRSGGAYGFSYQPVEVSVGIAASAGEHDQKKRMVYLEAPTSSRSHFQIIPRRTGIFNFTRSRFLANNNLVESQSQLPAPAPAPAPVDPATVGAVYPKERRDGWLEIELGEFFNKGGAEDKDLEIVLNEIKSGDWKGGIIVQGIEIRPKIST